jgi:lysozyme
MLRGFLFFTIVVFIQNIMFGAPLPVLQKEDEGLAVSLLQKLLVKAGFEIIATGRFDEKTATTVKKHQRTVNIYPHGIVNDSTWKSLLLRQKSKNQPPITGFDISHYENEVFKNGEIPFDAIKQNDMLFCYSKATHGGSRKDEWFDYNWQKCEEKHLLRGCYHLFSLLDDDIDAQINNFLSLNIDYNAPGILPAVLDVEEDVRNFDRNNAILNKALIVARMRIWLSAVESATGRKPMIYTRKSFWEEVLGNPTGFEDYPIWVAYYRNEGPPRVPTPWQEKWHFWQYTDRGLLKDAGRFDLNRFNGSYEELFNMANLTVE